MPIPVFVARFRTLVVVAACAFSVRIVFSAPPVETPPLPDFDRQSRHQADTDKAWRVASQGYMTFEKIAYRSRAGDLDNAPVAEGEALRPFVDGAGVPGEGQDRDRLGA